MLRVASHEEQQVNRRRMSIAYAIAAVLVPAFSLADFLFHAVDPSFPLAHILAIRLVVSPILFVAALRTRRPELTAVELLRGEPLSALVVREAPLEPARAVWIAAQVARALAEAHGRGIVHRDVKPENVFLTHAGDEGDHAKVLDFGIARVASAHETGLTATGVIGTPQYLAPELLLGDKATARADVYALGVVLFQMLTGALPFAAEDARALLLARISLDPREVRELAPHVPEALVDVVRRALAREPAQRIADGRALADALVATGLVDGYRPPRARPPGPTTLVASERPTVVQR
jgi:serine/threonine-protein kinase